MTRTTPTTPATGARERRRVRRAAGAPVRARPVVAAGRCVAVAVLCVPLGLIVVYTRRRRLGGAGRCCCARGSASCCATPSGWSSLRRGLLRGRSASARPGWSSGPTLPRPAVWRVLLVAPLAVPAFVNSFAWVSLLPRRRGLRRRGAGRHAVLLPVRLPAGRRGAARPRPGPGGDRARARASAAGATFRRVVLPQLRPALLGGVLLVGAAPAGRVRRAGDAALPDLHHRDLRPVPVAFNGPAANVLAGVLVAALPARCCWPSCGCAGGAATPASGAGRPARSGRARLGRSRRRPGRCSAGAVGLALGVPLGSLGRWLRRRHLDGVPARRAAAAAAVDARPGRWPPRSLTVRWRCRSAWLRGAHRGRLSTLIERSTYLGHALPGSWSRWRW